MLLAQTSLPNAAPPATVNAPLVWSIALALFRIVTKFVVVDPRSVIVCSVLVFQTITSPWLKLTAVSVPAVNVVTAKFLTVEVVIICPPAT